MGFSPLPRGQGRPFFGHPCGPPPGITRASPCPGVDRPASGRARVTIPPFKTAALGGIPPAAFRFPYGFGVYPLSLATRAHSPARSSKRTAEPDSLQGGTPASPSVSHLGDLTGPARLSPPGFRLFSLPITGSFHLSVALLVRYRARGVFSLGGWLPPASRRKSNRRYSGPWELPNRLPLRGCHPLRPRTSTGVRVSGWGEPQGLNTTSPHGYPWGLGLGFSLFGRPYSGNRICFLFLRVLRCFTSPRSLTGGISSRMTGVLAPVRSSHSGIPGSTVACTSPGHLAACRPLPRLPSPGIHRAGSWGCV